MACDEAKYGAQTVDISVVENSASDNTTMRTVAQSVRAKSIIYVTDFGDANTCKNYSENDYPAVQAAINAAEAIGGIAKVELPGGECLLNQTLTINGPIILEGAGAGAASGSLTNTQSTQLLANFAAGDVIQAASYYGFVFRDFQIASNVGVRTAGAGIHIMPAGNASTNANSVVTNIATINMYDGIDCERCSGAHINNTYHQGYRHDGIRCYSSTTIESGCFDISGNTVFGSTYTKNPATSGSGYVNGVYTNVPLLGGAGNGMTATIIVTSGAVSSVEVTSLGNNSYAYNDVLTASAAELGGRGSGFTYNANIAYVQYAGIEINEGYTNVHNNLVGGSQYAILLSATTTPGGHPQVKDNVIENFTTYGIRLQNAVLNGAGLQFDNIEIASNQMKNLCDVNCHLQKAYVSVAPNADGTGVSWITNAAIHDEMYRAHSERGANYIDIRSGTNVAIRNIQISHSIGNDGDAGNDVAVVSDEPRNILISGIQDNNEAAWSGKKYASTTTATQIMDMQGLPLASVPTTLANGSAIYVTDGTPGTLPMVGNGKGALGYQVNGVFSSPCLTSSACVYSTRISVIQNSASILDGFAVDNPNDRGAGSQILFRQDRSLVHALKSTYVANKGWAFALSYRGQFDIWDCYDNQSCSFLGPIYKSADPTIVAAGTRMSTATMLTRDVNVVVTVPSGGGVRLAPWSVVAGTTTKQDIFNRGASTLFVYPPSILASIESGAAGVAVSLAVGRHAVFACVSATKCYQAP